MTNKGGFVPGESYTDDRVTARVNSGEAVPTAAQQRNFMALANGERGGSGTQLWEEWDSYAGEGVVAGITVGLITVRL